MTETSEWRTGISYVTPADVIIRGYPLQDLIASLDFGGLVYLLLKGELPTPGQSKMINALLVAVADHGISPSQVVTRYVAAAGSPVQASVAAGVLMFGDYHGGAGQQVAEMLRRGVAQMRERKQSLAQAARDVVNDYRSRKEPLAGFGHPEHTDGDPRPPLLFRIASDADIMGEHSHLLVAIENALAESVGRKIPINIDGALGAIVSDLGFPPVVARGMMIVARTAGLLANSLEETTREKPWRRAPAYSYDGPALRKSLLKH